MKILQKIGRAFKWFGKKTLFAVRSNEILIVASLAPQYIPIPALDKILLLIRSLDRKNVPGVMKMAEALEKILPILAEYGVEIKEESDLRFLIELVLKIMKKKAVILPKED